MHSDFILYQSILFQIGVATLGRNILKIITSFCLRIQKVALLTYVLFISVFPSFAKFFKSFFRFHAWRQVTIRPLLLRLGKS